MCVLAALCGDPSVLLLDEPSNGLDPAGVATIVEIVEERRQRGLSAMLVSNDASLVACIAGTHSHYRLDRGALTPAPPL